MSASAPFADRRRRGLWILALLAGLLDWYDGTESTTGDSELAGGDLLARWQLRQSERAAFSAGAYISHSERDIPSVFSEQRDTYDLELEQGLGLGNHELLFGLGYRHSPDGTGDPPRIIIFEPANRTLETYDGFVQHQPLLAGGRGTLTLGAKSAASLRRSAAALLLCCLSSLLLPPPVAAEASLELKVKAAFLFNFVRFVGWPPERAPALGQPYVLCTLDSAEFAAVLAETVNGKQVDGHGLQVLALRSGDALGACHVAYVAGNDPAVVDTQLRGAGGLGVLTVHEASAAVPSGVLRFFIDDRRVRFEVNGAAAERQRLQLSSRLLGVATRL